MDMNAAHICRQILKSSCGTHVLHPAIRSTPLYFNRCTVGRQAKQLAQGGVAFRGRQARRKRLAPGGRAGVCGQRIGRRRDSLQRSMVVLVQPACTLLQTFC